MVPLLRSSSKMMANFLHSIGSGAVHHVLNPSRAKVILLGMSCFTLASSMSHYNAGTPLINFPSRPHVCETCGKGFAQYSGLKTHRNVQYEIVTEVLRDILMERVSTRSKPYMCGIGTCTKAFGDPSSRARHRKETHRREGAYKCIITDCGTRLV